MPTPNKKSQYTPVHFNEKTRLGNQADFYRFFDMRLFRLGLSNIDNPVGLDIGCAQGTLTFDRFSSFSISPVLGIDANKEAIETARSKAENEQGDWRFECEPVLTEKFDRTIRNFVSEHEGRPVVCLIAYVLHHLDEPSLVLETLRKLLPSGSRILIRTLDDGAKLVHPDPGGGFARIIEATSLPATAANRQHGRALQGEIQDAGFTYFSMILDTIHSDGMTQDMIEQYLDITLLHRRNGLVRDLNLAYDPELAKALEDVDRFVPLVHERLTRRESFFMDTVFGAVIYV